MAGIEEGISEESSMEEQNSVIENTDLSSQLKGEDYKIFEASCIKMSPTKKRDYGESCKDELPKEERRDNGDSQNTKSKDVKLEELSYKVIESGNVHDQCPDPPGIISEEKITDTQTQVNEEKLVANDEIQQSESVKMGPLGVPLDETYLPDISASEVNEPVIASSPTKIDIKQKDLNTSVADSEFEDSAAIAKSFNDAVVQFSKEAGEVSKDVWDLFAFFWSPIMRERYGEIEMTINIIETATNNLSKLRDVLNGIRNPSRALGDFKSLCSVSVQTKNAEGTCPNCGEGTPLQPLKNVQENLVPSSLANIDEQDLKQIFLKYVQDIFKRIQDSSCAFDIEQVIRDGISGVNGSANSDLVGKGQNKASKNIKRENDLQNRHLKPKKSDEKENEEPKMNEKSPTSKASSMKDPARFPGRVSKPPPTTSIGTKKATTPSQIGKKVSTLGTGNVVAPRRQSLQAAQASQSASSVPANKTVLSATNSGGIKSKQILTSGAKREKPATAKSAIGRRDKSN